jgi:hypothetical protein
MEGIGEYIFGEIEGGRRLLRVSDILSFRTCTGSGSVLTSDVLSLLSLPPKP